MMVENQCVLQQKTCLKDLRAMVHYFWHALSYSFHWSSAIFPLCWRLLLIILLDLHCTGIDWLHFVSLIKIKFTFVKKICSSFMNYLSLILTFFLSDFQSHMIKFSPFEFIDLRFSSRILRGQLFYFLFVFVVKKSNMTIKLKNARQ